MIAAAARRQTRRLTSSAFDRIGPRLVLWGAVVGVVAALAWFVS